MFHFKTKVILLGLLLSGFLPTARAYAADIYVDVNSSTDNQDGSESYPFHTINAALSKAQSNSESAREIFVKQGSYPEEITLPDNTVLVGESKEKVIIDREGGSGYTVIMGKDTRIENLTVRGGNYGVLIPTYKKSTIKNCLVEKSKRIGVWIKRNNKSQTNMVDIWDSSISNNYKKGIYAQARFIYFINNQILNNGEEGIDLRSKIVGAISNNTVSSNGEGGIEAEIRNAGFEISNNTLSLNSSNGITLNNRTHTGGKIIIKNNIIRDNKKYGIRCAGTKKWSKKLWKKVIKTSDNSSSGNKKTYLSPSCHAR